MTASVPNARLYKYVFWGAITLLGLLVTRELFGYAAFHTLVELYAVTVAIGTFMITWNARRYIDNGYLMFLGIAYFFVAGADALHMLSYKDVSIFEGYSEYELPTQLWLVGRYLQASAIVLAPAFVTRRVRPSLTFAIYGAAFVTLAALVFTGVFPSALPAAGSLTPFKVGSEWVVIAAFVVGLTGLATHRRAFDAEVLRLLAVSVVASIGAEFAFTLYGDPFATPNLIGHLLRIVAFFALYRAIIETGVSRPHGVLARRLQAANEQLRVSRDLSQALNAIDQSINSTFDIDEVMTRATSLGAEAFGAGAATVWSRDGDGWIPRVAHGYPDILVGRTIPESSIPYVTEALRRGAPFAVPDAVTYATGAGINGTAHSIRSILAIPLLLRDESLGVLSFAWLDEPHEFTAEEIDFARRLGSALALAIDNARLYEAQATISETLQASMLRVDKNIPGIDSAYAYRSATELAKIGGDFFDLFRLDETRVAFVIGDVAGKGLNAAALTQIAKNTLRAFAYELQEPPVVMEAANRAIGHQVTEGRFITALYGLLDVSTGQAEIACAGHPLPLACDSHGCVEQHGVRNPPLGVISDLTFETYHITLEPRMRLVMFSDGLLDARSGDEFFGEARVNELLDALGDADPDHIAESLLAAAVDLGEGHPTDDIAIVAIRYLGPK